MSSSACLPPQQPNLSKFADITTGLPAESLEGPAPTVEQLVHISMQVSEQCADLARLAHSGMPLKPSLHVQAPWIRNNAVTHATRTSIVPLEDDGFAAIHETDDAFDLQATRRTNLTNFGVRFDATGQMQHVLWSTYRHDNAYPYTPAFLGTQSLKDYAGFAYQLDLNQHHDLLNLAPAARLRRSLETRMNMLLAGTSRISVDC